MTTLTQPLNEADDVILVGGKALALGKLIRAGFPVPPGFVITSQAFNRPTPHLKAKIWQALADLDSDWVAVRSSAVSEDGASAAWAGQLDSFLNSTKLNLIENIEACWRSASSDRAQAYATQQSLVVGPVAVIIQAMIQAEVSGVAFSVDPISADSNRIIIEAGLGLGEAVVSGEITPDTFIVNKQTGEIIGKEISRQTKMLVRDDHGKNQWETIDIGFQKLTNEHVTELAKTVTKLETYFGHAVDVEWAVYDGTLYIVQCRPITTLPTV